MQEAYILTTCPYFDNLKFNIFDAVGSPQGHFITPVTACWEISIWPLISWAKRFISFLISNSVRLAISLSVKSPVTSPGFRSRGAEITRGGTFFKFNIGCMQQSGPNMKWWAKILNGVWAAMVPPPATALEITLPEWLKVPNSRYHGWRSLFQSGGHKCKLKKL